MAYRLEAVRQDELSRIRMLIRMVIRIIKLERGSLQNYKAIFTLINQVYRLIIRGKPAEK